MRVTKNVLPADVTRKIEGATKSVVMSATSLGGGCVAQVKRVVMANGREYVAKIGKRGIDNGLEIEAYMLKYLANQTSLPTSEVSYADPELLLMDYITVNSANGDGVEEHAAELLAELHAITAPSYGLERDTLIGGLHQPNPQTASWVEFFRDQRLMYMAKEALDHGSLPISVMKKVEKLAEKLDEWIDEPEKPSLIHGDVWTGNVLYKDDRVVAFIDPAIYFADPEIEFTFATVWSTFGEPFFKRYQEIRPLQPDFFDVRRHLYNLYPLLVHTRLFGTSYAMLVDNTVSRFVGTEV